MCVPMYVCMYIKDKKAAVSFQLRGTLAKAAALEDSGHSVTKSHVMCVHMYDLTKTFKERNFTHHT
jgi:hypothetical protein